MNSYKNNKKFTKLILMIFVLIILICFSKKLLQVSTLHYKLKYDKNEFEIKETYAKDNYYIEIINSEKVYPIRIYNNLNNKRKIIDKIYFYQDMEFECLLPIINGEIIVDIMCYKDEIIYDYHNIIGLDINLDDYVDSIELYDIDRFADDLSKENSINTVKVYRNNNINNIVAITTYKGLIISGIEIELFKEDIYNNKISTFVDNYYLIADYNNNYEFENFYVVDLISKEIFKIKSKNEISLDSYIQGIVDSKVYLYDKDNENQYEIDINNKKITLISSDNSIKYYKNNTWQNMNKNKIKDEVYFDYETLENNFSDYDEILEDVYYYYLFKKNKVNYDLYRVDKNNLNVYKFLLTVPTTSISYNNNYIYYVFNNKLYYYSDSTGLKTLLEDSELEFNNTIKYYIY